MSKYYAQKPGKLYPIYGVSSLSEAQRYAGDYAIIESAEPVYMNIYTGSVDIASGWDDLSQCMEVEYDSNLETWIADEAEF